MAWLNSNLGQLRTLGSTPSGGLPPNFGFDDLANYQSNAYQNYAKNLSATLAQRRADLSNQLTNQGTSLFNAENPQILEDLNSRGLMTSPSAVATAQSNALRDIGLQNNQTLANYDQSALSTELGANQDALNSDLDLRNSQLSNKLSLDQQATQNALARDLAKQQSRNSLVGSLIGAGSSLGSGFLQSSMLKGLMGKGAAQTLGNAAATSLPGEVGGYAAPASASSSLFPGGIGAAGTSALPATVAGYAPPSYAASSLFPGGVGGTTATGAAPGAGIGGIGLGPLAAMGATGYGLAAADNALKGTFNHALGNTGGAIARAVSNPIGSQINAAKNFVSNPGKTLSRAFCFDANTPVDMADGTKRAIKDMNLGDETTGGTVLSFRASICADGDLHNYLGVIVTGSHAVLENGAWVRVEDSVYQAPLDGRAIVYSLVTSKHLLHISGITFADEFETDDYECLTLDESLEEMNRRDGFVRAN